MECQTSKTSTGRGTKFINSASHAGQLVSFLSCMLVGPHNQVTQLTLQSDHKGDKISPLCSIHILSWQKLRYKKVGGTTVCLRWQGSSFLMVPAGVPIFSNGKLFSTQDFLFATNSHLIFCLEFNECQHMNNLLSILTDTACLVQLVAKSSLTFELFVRF